MAQLERADLHGEIELRFPDNTTEEITPLAVREFLHELVDSALLAASDSLDLSKWVTLQQARAQLTLSPPALQGGQLYAIGGAWNAAGTSTVYVPALSNRAFHPQGVLFAGGIYSLVSVDVVAGTAAAVAPYIPIPQDKWGLNDPPQRLATINEALDYLHDRVATAPVTTTPTKPNWTYLSGPRTLSLAHATLAPSELEYTHDGGLTWLAYVGTLNIDDAKHEAGDYIGRVKAATGRNVSAIANSPAIAAAAVSAPTITSFSPASGPAGSTFVLTGTGFTGATLVSINSGAVASFQVNSATQITATLTSAQASGLVRVTTPAGTAVSTASFTVTASTGPTVLTPTNSDYSYNVFENTDYQSVHSDLGFATTDSYVDVKLKATLNNIDPDPYGIGLYKGNELIKYYPSPGAGVNTLRVALPNGGTRTTYSLRLGVQEGTEEGIPTGYTTIQSLAFPTDTLASFVKFANTGDVLYLQGDSITASVFASNLDKHYVARMRRLRPEMTIYSAGSGYKFLSYALATDAQIEAECQRVLKAWGTASKRRYALGLGGTNDANRGLDPSLVMDRAAKLFKRLLALAPDAMLYLVLMLDYGTASSDAYRKAGLALQTAELPNLRFLDGGQLEPADLADRLHPNDSGYGKEADKFHAQFDLPPREIPKPPTRPASNFTDADLAPLFYSDSLKGYVVKPHADGSNYTENYTVGGLTSKYMPAGQECEIILRAKYGVGNVVIGACKVAQAPTKYQDIDYGVLIGDQDQNLYTSTSPSGDLQPVGPMGDGSYAKFRRAANGALSVLTSTDNVTYTPIASKFDGLSYAGDLFICFMAQDNGTTALLSADCFNCATR